MARFSQLDANARYDLKLVALALLAMVLGCGGETQNAAPGKGPSKIDSVVLGEWVTAATSAGHYDGVMHLLHDGTFTEVDVFRKDGTKQSVTGTFEVRKSGETEVVVLSVKELDGKAVPFEGPPLTLTFDRAEGILYESFPGTLYARRGQESRALKELNLDSR